MTGLAPIASTLEAPSPPACRSCGTPLQQTFINLGDMPLANAYLHSPTDLDPRYPLHARICWKCLLVQADQVCAPASIFSDYAFFSGYSQDWINHTRAYVEDICRRFDPRTVIEIGSNDGTLLKHFPPDVTVLGVEPAANVAAVAVASGVPTKVAFFGEETVQSLLRADLIIANNVLGHVPDLNDFVAGLAVALNPNGVITVEVPHLLNLIQNVEFDTIYHEHFSYFSLAALDHIFARHDLRIFDAKILPIHGGSIRIYACHESATHLPAIGDLRVIAFRERGMGLLDASNSAYREFAYRAEDNISHIQWWLGEMAAKGELVIGAGAPAKGNTLLNAVGASPHTIPFTTDNSPHKQGMFLPGTHIEILPQTEEIIRAARPAYVLILAWNWYREITEKLSYVHDWNCRFVVPIPRMKVMW